MIKKREDMEIIPGPEWENLLRDLRRNKGVAMIIGETDSGKSTLARYLIKKLLAKGITVSLVDCDIGQSSLGLPSTISMRVFRNEPDYGSFIFKRMSFLGTSNPAMVIPAVIKTGGRMVDLAKRASEITLVDTTGLVSGELGRILKLGKIRRIRPDHIIAVSSGQDLEHILESTGRLHIHRISKALNVRTRNRAERTHYRRRKIREYFRRAPLCTFTAVARNARFFYYSRPFGPEDRAPLGTVIGLNRYMDTLGLGIVLHHAEGSVTFLSPVRPAKRSSRVIFGDITI